MNVGYDCDVSDFVYPVHKARGILRWQCENAACGLRIPEDMRRNTPSRLTGPHTSSETTGSSEQRDNRPSAPEAADTDGNQLQGGSRTGPAAGTDGDNPQSRKRKREGSDGATGTPMKKNPRVGKGDDG